jgi:hypothetical protein
MVRAADLAPSMNYNRTPHCKCVAVFLFAALCLFSFTLCALNVSSLVKL